MMLHSVFRARQRAVGLMARLQAGSAAQAGVQCPPLKTFEDAIGALRSGGCSIEADGASPGRLHLSYAGDAAAFPVQALCELARAAALDPDLVPDALALLKDALDHLATLVQTPDPLCPDWAQLPQRLNGLDGQRWQAFEDDLRQCCLTALGHEQAGAVSLVLHLSALMNAPCTEELALQVAARMGRADLIVRHHGAWHARQRLLLLPLLFELASGIGSPALAIRYFDELTDLLNRTRTVRLSGLPVQALLNAVGELAGQLEEVEAASHFHSSAQALVQAVLNLLEGWDAAPLPAVRGLLGDLARVCASLIERDGSHPPSDALLRLAETMWALELLARDAPAPSQITLNKRFDLCSAGVKRALLSIAPNALFPGAAKQDALFVLLLGFLQSYTRTAEGFVGRLMQDPALSWLPQRVMAHLVGSAHPERKREMPLLLPLLLAWAGQSAARQALQSRHSALYEITSLVMALSRGFDLSVDDLREIGAYLPLGQKAGEVQSQLVWFEQPNMPASWAIALLQGWLAVASAAAPWPGQSGPLPSQAAIAVVEECCRRLVRERNA